MFAHAQPLVLTGVISLCAATAVRGQTFTNGDVFVAIGSGSVQWRHADSTLVSTLVSGILGNRFTAGMAFDKSGRLYVTMFDSQNVSIFDQSGNFVGLFGSGYDQDPESILFDADGNAYVGQADGTHQILKFDPLGSPLAQFSVATEDRGSDWIDLAQDQCTIFYTSEGKKVMRFDVCANAQLPDFNTTDLSGSFDYALRILPNDDVLVADSQNIIRLDDSGGIIQTYDMGNNDNWFALNIDPDGTSFWSADLVSGDVAKFDIAGGQVLLSF